MSLFCPKCSSDSVQKLSVMYETGTSDFSANTVEFGLGSGHRGGIAIATTEGKSQSLLAQKYAPPKQDSAASAIGCLFALGLVVAIALGATFDTAVVFWAVLGLVGVLGIALARQAAAHNRDSYPQSRALWERRFICLRCGNIFEPALNAPAKPTVGENESTSVQAQRRYSVRLLFAGSSPIAALKLVREEAGLKILDAKRLVDFAPSVIRSNLSVEEAERLQRRFVEIGASTELLEDDISPDSSAAPSPDRAPGVQPMVDASVRRCRDCGKPIFRADGSCAHCESENQKMPPWLIAGVAVFLIAGVSFAISLRGGTQPKAPEKGGSKGDFASSSGLGSEVRSTPTEKGLSLSPLGARTISAPAQPRSSGSGPDISAASGTESASPNEAVELVTRFYQALSSADGIAAATYIVPEKRQHGPLSGVELTAKYSTLKTPLQLAEVWPGRNGLIDAHYSYTSQAGLKCLASSAVKLASHSGDLFIDEVYVNEKCQ